MLLMIFVIVGCVLLMIWVVICGVMFVCLVGLVRLCSVLVLVIVFWVW